MRRLLVVVTFLTCASAMAQFRDDFDTVKGWRFRTGDGNATMDFRRGGKGYASIFVDATKDKRNIWWALIQHDVSRDMDLSLLEKPGFEVRIEARIRVSHAPRRVNLQIQTQRTTDYHSHLMEYDIPDTTGWHTISMTTREFDARPGDTLIGHMALMDWGLEKYRVDVDYMKVDIIEVAKAPPDVGAAVPYHPPVADPATFDHALKALHETPEVLTVDATHHAILRFDFSGYAGKRVAGGGLLELTTHSVARIGLLRVVEVVDGAPSWELNPQMIIDWPANEAPGGKTLLTISQPVLQRLIDGRTHGIAITALGDISASFYRSRARLLLTLEKRSSFTCRLY